MKRSRIDTDKESKRFKFNKTSFEDLPNEIIYEIFDHLTHFHAYQAFYFLKEYFHSKYPLHIHLPSISKSSFNDYYQTVFLPNQQRIRSLHLTNPFAIDTIFSLHMQSFDYLETLVLDHPQSFYLRYLSSFPRLSSLTIHSLDCTYFFTDIIRLPKLKFCQINLQSIVDLNYQSISIEILIIKYCFQYRSLSNLFFILPELRSLTIDYLDGSSNHELSLTNLLPPKNLKKLSIKLDLVDFSRFEKIVRYFLYSIEYLRITTEHDPNYLDAQQWESLIKIYLPNLRIFDLNHDGLIRNQSITYHECINQFNSSFWFDRQWIFTHQHDWQERSDAGIFYSTNPYRRTNYTFYWPLKYQKCSIISETNLSNVKHVRIGSKHATKSTEIYFPNAIELTIDYFFKTSDQSISITLNRHLPLQQIRKLTIDFHQFPFEEIVRLLNSMHNVEQLILDSIIFESNHRHFIQITDNFDEYAKNRTIKHLEIRNRCSFEHIELVVYLFPMIECLKTKFSRKEIRPILRYLFAKMNYLNFLCVFQVNRKLFEDICIFIENEDFVDDFSIRLLDRNVFLWW